MSAATARRLKTVPGVMLAAWALLVLIPLWVPLAVLADLVRGKLRLPLTRLLAFAFCWSWLESIGVTIAAGLWLFGRRRDTALHFRLQRWWAGRLMDSLRITTGIAIDATDSDAVSPGPAIMLCRHASLADSLVSAWVITNRAHMNPRYVLKKELLFDPCLDIVGNRLPNHFLDRESPDSSSELAALTVLAAGLAADEIAVIFPEGTRTSPKKRVRALAKIAERDPERAERLAALQHLLPPRPAGSAALLAGHPTADIVVAWHIGFDGLDTFGGILRRLADPPPPIEFHARRFSRDAVPSGDAFTRWLDDEWLQSDRAVHQLLHPEGTP